jgi:subtilisin family serine protease
MKSVFLFVIFVTYACVAGTQTPVRPVYTAKTIKIAVIDTGFDFDSSWNNAPKDADGKQLRKPKLCNEGHKDFTGKGMQDNIGHGTHVAGVIAKFAEDADYCIVILKIFESQKSSTKTMGFSVAALKYASTLDIDIVNYSGGGDTFSIEEYLAVKKLLDKGVVFVAAAGNEKTVNNYKILKIDIQYSHKVEGKEQVVFNYKPYFINTTTGEISNTEQSGYYPADYDSRVISVANVYLDETSKNWKFSPSSNRGDSVNFKEKGTDVLSIIPRNSVGYMTGTSQAAPTRVGKMIKMWGSK